MPIRLSLKFFVLFAVFLTLLGCRDYSSGGPDTPPGTSHAYFLKNVGGDVTITNLSSTAIYGETTVSDGSGSLGASQWKVDLSALSSEELVVVRVGGGTDISGQSLSVSENAKVFAVASAEAVRNGIHVSPLTDLVWRISKRYVQRSERTDSLRYLDNLAGLFLSEDLNDDGSVNYRDVLDFNPNDPQHNDSLALDFSILCCDSQTYVTQVLSGTPADEVDTEIKNLVGGSVSLAQDESISQYAGITVVGFGAGYVLDENGERVYDPSRIKSRFHVAKSRSNSYYLTAYPDSDSQILGWDGCDSVSVDGTRCELSSFKRDRVVEINFGYTEVSIAANFVGLGEGLTGEVTADRITVDLPSDPTLKSRLMNLSAGDKASLIVNGKALLVSILDVINYPDSVEFGYAQAKLTDVIEKGTGTFSKVFSADDIESIEYPSSLVSQASQSLRIKPYKLLVQPSNDSSVIRLAVEPAEADSKSLNPFNNVWEVNERLVELSGSIDVTFELDVSASFEFYEGLQFFKVSPSISNEANIALKVEGSVKTPKDANGNDVIRELLGRIYFSRTAFLIGFVPVYLNPYVDVYIGGNGEVTGQMGLESTMSSSVFAGVYYSKGAGWEYSSGSGSDWSPAKPFLEGEARFRMYAAAEPTVQIYDLMGPAINFEAYSEIRASYDIESECNESLVYGIYAGLGSVLEWKATGGEKFFEVVGISPADLRVNIGLKEAKIFEDKLNTCGPAPASMLVNGTGISEIIEEGDSSTIARTVSIENVGGQSLTWRADYQNDSYLTVYPDGGEIPPGETQTLSMSFNNQGSSEIRTYKNLVQISQVGSAYDSATPFRRIDVDVVPKKISPPEIVEAFRDSEDPTVAEIEWSVEPADEPYIARFDAYLTHDPVLAQQKENNHENPAWEKFAEFGRTQRKVTVSGLPDERVFLSIQAIGTKGQTVQAKTYELKEKADHGLVARTSSGAMFLTHDGSWNATATENAAFGNIDWKGHYVGDTPTKILSWSGPSSRYFGEAGFSSEIYQGGKLFSVAPGNVHGAAIVADGVGDEWLVAVVNDSVTDTLYVRPNTPSTSSALYDSVTYPDGWREIASQPINGEISGGWFFDGAGKIAKSVRWVKTTITSWGNDFEVYISDVNRLSLDLGAATPGVLGAAFSADTSASSMESALLAVDFNKTGEVELRLSADKWLEVNGQSVIPNSELNIICYSSSYTNCEGSPKFAHMTRFGEFGIEAGDYAQDGGNRIATIHYLDLRSGLFAYGVSHQQSRNIEGNYRVRHGNEVVAATNKTEVIGWAASTCMSSRGFLERVDAFDFHCSSAAFGMEPPNGSWATGPSGEILLSQKSISSSGGQTLNYINNGGNLAELLGVLADQGAFTVGVK
ncbi:hypothetical protein MD273_10830 [Marinobacter pelagius]|nr:hypothetical protein [Marinobacter sp. C7]